MTRIVLLFFLSFIATAGPAYSQAFQEGVMGLPHKRSPVTGPVPPPAYYCANGSQQNHCFKCYPNCTAGDKTPENRLVYIQDPKTYLWRLRRDDDPDLVAKELAREKLQGFSTGFGVH